MALCFEGGQRNLVSFQDGGLSIFYSFFVPAARASTDDPKEVKLPVNQKHG